METMKYEWFRGKDGAETFCHVHSDEMTELEQWIHGLLFGNSEGQI